ncbi:Ionotropic receptor 143 [Blattella germanica]|nr:Ionotropic receptor 143 [Blattella germanica]
MAPNIIKFLITSVSIALRYCIAEDSNDLQDQVAVMTSLKQHFHSGCLFLIQSETTNFSLMEGVLQTRLAKVLSERNVRSATVSCETMMTSPIHSIQCHKNRPIYTFTSVDNSTRRFLMNFKRISMRSSIWLLFMRNELSIEDFFANIYVTFDSEFLIARRESEETLLTEVYKVDEEWPLQKRLFGLWSPQKGLDTVDQSFYIRRNDLQGFVMRGVTHETNQYTLLNYEGNQTKLKDGYFGFLWNEFQEGLNFRTHFIQHKSTTDVNKRFSEMIIMIKNENLDVAVDAFPVSSTEFDYIDYTTPAHNERFRILIRPQRKSDMGISTYLGPFSHRLWYVVGIFIILLASSLALFHHIGRIFISSEDFDWPWRYSFSTSLFYVFGIFCQQGHDITPRSSGCRVVYWSAYLTSLVILAAYSGTLISFLTIHRDNFPFNDLPGLLKDPTYKIGTLQKYMHYFQGNESGIMFEAYKKKMISKPIGSYVEGLKDVCEKNMVFWASIDTSGLYMDNVACTILPIPKYGFDFNVAMVLAKNSPYRIFLDHMAALLRDSGILRRKHQLEWFVRSPLAHDAWSSVSLEQVQPLLIIVAFGIILSSCIMGLEILLSRISRTNLHPSTTNTITKQRLKRLPKYNTMSSFPVTNQLYYSKETNNDLFTLSMFQNK